MHSFRIILVCSLLFCIAESCSRKTTPAKETASANNSSTKPDTVAKALVIYKPVKTATPKSIAVNDMAAKKAVDGRMYYDLEGKRYWRSKKDGRYYLYYKGIFDNPDFQK